MSWRCNGQVECLGDGDELGSDEEDCEALPHQENEATLVPPENPSSSVVTSNVEMGRRASDLSAPAQGGPCGGNLQAFYGSFVPPVLTGSAMECVWSVDPQDSRPLKLELQQLALGSSDVLIISDQPGGGGNVILNVTSASNYKTVEVESPTGLLSLTYRVQEASDGRGFNATYRIADYCLPGEGLCKGSDGGCYMSKQHCDGHWDCAETGLDEDGCGGCPAGYFPCGTLALQRTPHSRPACYSIKERCNYQLNCADGSDERECKVCQPGTFHCDSDRCVFESWRCDGQVDCKDGTDELNCTITLPRKVITAATVGSLVCGLLLVIAMGCTCKLYSLRTREHSLFAPITRQEAEFIQQQAPPSYGQLIAQGIIPPVEDFPTENPNEPTSLSLRGLLQILRQDNISSPRRRRRPRIVRRAIRRLRRCGRANENYRTESCLGVTIPDDHLRGCAVYPHPDRPDLKVIKEDGAGLPDADVVLYVTAQSTDKCRADSSVLAYSAHCQSDPEGRPLAGIMVICREPLSSEGFSHEQMVQTVIHEMLHVLGFSKELFSKWTDHSLSSQRGINYFHGQMIYSDQFGQMRLYSPNVNKALHIHLNTSHTDLGAPLENQDADSRGFSSHWEARVMQGSIMTAMLPEPALVQIDAITLSALQDTGWYAVNHSHGQNLLWGENEGAFFGSVSTCTRASSFFCTGSEFGCHYLHLHKGVCQSDQYLEGCRIYKPLANGSECWKEENETGSGPEVWSGEIFHSDSRCFLSNIIKEDRSALNASLSGRCYRHRCTGRNKYQIKVRGSDWLNCPPGRSIKVFGYRGAVFCPDKRLCHYQDITPPTSLRKPLPTILNFTTSLS
ncbi:low-density lipoprotein receptor-related protein 10, partial [Clarias magur]